MAKKNKKPEDITREQVKDAYFEGTSDGINIQGATEEIEIPKEGYDGMFSKK